MLLRCRRAIDWLAKPENLQQTDNLPPFIENLDIGAYVATALPIAGFVLGINVLDEVVQRGVALQRKVLPHYSPNFHTRLQTPHHVWSRLLAIPTQSTFPAGVRWSGYGTRVCS